MFAITAAGVDRVLESNAMVFRRDRMIAETTAPNGGTREEPMPPTPIRLVSG
jgi:hypothetical protein